MKLPKTLLRLPHPLPLLLTIGGAGVVLLTIGIVLLLSPGILGPSPGKTPASLLPADATAAYFSGITGADARRLGKRFPSLTPLSLPEIGQDVDVAVVRLPDGSFGTVTFIGGAMMKAISSRLPLDTETFVVRPSSSPAMTALLSLDEKTARLSSTPSFERLTQGAAKPWVYLDSALLETAVSEADRALLSSLTPDPHIVLAWKSGSTRLSFLRPPAGSRSVSPPAAFSPAPGFSASLADAAGAIGWARQLLPASGRMPIEAKIDRTVQDLLGTDVSARYDVLPLLTGDTTLALSPSGPPDQPDSGQAGPNGIVRAGTGFLLAGREEPGRLQKLLPRLHASVRASLSTQRIRRRDLKEGYTSVTIEDDPSVLEEREEQRGGWTVRTTRRTDTGAGLLSAIRGNAFILTNDGRWLRQLTGTPPPPALPLPATRGTPFAAGTASRSFLGEPLKGTLGLTLPGILLDTFGPGGDRMTWVVARDGEVVTVSVIRNDQ